MNECEELIERSIEEDYSKRLMTTDEIIKLIMCMQNDNEKETWKTRNTV